MVRLTQATIAGLGLLAACHSGPQVAPRDDASRKALNISDDRAYLPPLASIEPIRLGKSTFKAPVAQSHSGFVKIQTNGGAHTYQLHFVDVMLGVSYKAEIVYPSAGGTQVLRTSEAEQGASDDIRTDGSAGGIAALVRDNPKALVLNGGFSAGDPSQPAGLLLVNDKVQSPFNFSHYGNDRTRPLRLAAIVCATRDGYIDFIPASEFERGVAKISERCRSALQTTPFVVQSGQSRISRHEPDVRTAAIRTMLGIDRRGSLHAIFFLSPIHLAVAAEILRAKTNDANDTIHVSGATSIGLMADQGLGLTDVVNLDGDADSTGALLGHTIVGDLARDLPSAIIVLP